MILYKKKNLPIMELEKLYVYVLTDESKDLLGVYNSSISLRNDLHDYLEAFFDSGNDNTEVGIQRTVIGQIKYQSTKKTYEFDKESYNKVVTIITF